MWWRNLTFIHVPVAAESVQSMLPADLTVDTWKGRAWVGLVPFEMEVMTPGGVPIPREGRFAETNVRTYVHGPDGTPGVWFHSLEAARLSATVAARFSYGLPYFWASMRVANAGPVWTYESARRWPGPKGAHHQSAVRVGGVIDEHSHFERFLTARWGLFSTWRGRTVYAPVWHAPWDLHTAEIEHLDDGLVEAAGFGRVVAEHAEPVVHWTPGVEVRIGRPRFVQSP